MSGSAPDDLYSLLGGAHSGIEAPIGDRRIPCVPALPAQHTFPLTLKARGSDQTHTFPWGAPWGVAPLSEPAGYCAVQQL